MGSMSAVLGSFLCGLLLLGPRVDAGQEKAPYSCTQTGGEDGKTECTGPPLVAGCYIEFKDREPVKKGCSNKDDPGLGWRTKMEKEGDKAAQDTFKELRGFEMAINNACGATPNGQRVCFPSFKDKNGSLHQLCCYGISTLGEEIKDIEAKTTWHKMEINRYPASLGEEKQVIFKAKGNKPKSTFGASNSKSAKKAASSIFKTKRNRAEKSGTFSTFLGLVASARVFVLN